MALYKSSSNIGLIWNVVPHINVPHERSSKTPFLFCLRSLELPQSSLSFGIYRTPTTNHHHKAPPSCKPNSDLYFTSFCAIAYTPPNHSTNHKESNSIHQLMLPSHEQNATRTEHIQCIAMPLLAIRCIQMCIVLYQI